jgi:hypothetical protein
LVVEIDDLETEDLLSQLPRCMDFMYDHSKDGGNVLVHWYVLGKQKRPMSLVRGSAL